MHSAAARPPRDETLAQGKSWVPAEGWLVVLLHAALLATTGWAIARAGWASGTVALMPVAMFGWLVGFVQAKAKVPDFMAHTLAVLMGVVVSALATTAIMEDGGSGRRARLDLLWAHFTLWFRQMLKGNPGDDIDLFVLVMAITLWLVAYCSAWMLFRRHWLGVAILLPGIIVLINVGYAPRSGTGPIVVFVLAAGVLAARHFVFRREQEWRLARIPSPARLSGRFFQAGLTVTLIVMLLGWALPSSTSFDPAKQAWDQYGQHLTGVQDRLNTLFAKLGQVGPGKGSTYPQFGESFRLGGPLNLGNQAVLILQAPQPEYLIAHSYDYYDGHGWKSDVDETFSPDGGGEGSAPQVTFQPGQQMHLSADVSTKRAPEQSTITLIQPSQNLLLTTDTYATSDQSTSVQLSWRQLKNEPFDVQHVDLATVPPDLASFIQLLRGARFQPGGNGAADTALNPAVGQQIAAAQSELEHRFLHTTWEIDASGKVTTLHVTGKVPVYDDVEAVFDQQQLAPQSSYTVTGLTSIATPEQLREAGTKYPDFVIDRYLELPTTITQRTRALARQVTAGDINPFDQAMAIQNFVRNRITYDENVNFPPSNQDVVDYVLFDSKKGYCEYYASAMIVMLRSLGVPARMMVGFYPAPYDASVGAYVYRERYAHAWVEVYFPQYGWIPFEPTAARPPLDYGANGVQPQAAAVPTVTIEPSPVAPMVQTATPAVPPVTKPNNSSGSHTALSGREQSLGWATGIGLLILFLVAAVGLFAWIWGLRGLSQAGGLYARLLRIGRLIGIQREPAMTPSEYADEVGRAVPGARAAARYMADLYAAEQYGERPASGAAAATGARAWQHVRRESLFALVSLRRRWRARRERRDD